MTVEHRSTAAAYEVYKRAVLNEEQLAAEAENGVRRARDGRGDEERRERRPRRDRGEGEERRERRPRRRRTRTLEEETE